MYLGLVSEPILKPPFSGLIGDSGCDDKVRPPNATPLTRCGAGT